MPTFAPTRRSLLAGLGASLATTLTSARAHEPTTPPGWGTIDLLDANDRSFRLAQCSQKFTLVMLWANWCGVCLRELDTVGGILPALGAGDIDLVLLSHPHDWARNQDITRQRNLALRTARPSASNPISLLHSALLSADGTFYVPRSILFDRERDEVVWSHSGSLDWRSAEAIGRLRRLVG